jgi:hypothetical protein
MLNSKLAGILFGILITHFSLSVFIVATEPRAILYIEGSKLPWIFSPIAGITSGIFYYFYCETKSGRRK